MTVFLIGGIKWETLFGMIIEGTGVMEFLVTFGTRNGLGFIMNLHDFLHFVPIMNSQTMNDTIPLCQGAKLASIKRTFELLGILALRLRLLWMFGTHVQIQRLLLQKSLFTKFTLMGELLLVLFHVVVHGGLITLLVITVRAGEEAIFILLVLDHGLGFLRCCGVYDAFFGSR